MECGVDGFGDVVGVGFVVLVDGLEKFSGYACVGDECGGHVVGFDDGGDSAVGFGPGDVE